MAENHGAAMVKALHELLARTEGIHADHRRRVAERAALNPIVHAAAVTATEEQLRQAGGGKGA